MIEQQLYALPAPQEAESLSAWLPRAAASQAESLTEFARFLGFSSRKDFDTQFLDVAPLHLAKLCGLPGDAFDLPFRMLDGARSLRLATPVLCTWRRRPLYRFCPLCMKQQRTPHFPMHWRLDAYRMCHIHRCLLEEECPHCYTKVTPQHDWMNAGPQKKGISMASQCRKCAKLLWQVIPIPVDEHVAISPLEKAQLENGRPFAAALAQGRVILPYSTITDLRIGIKVVEKSRLLCQGSELTADYLRGLKTTDVASIFSERFDQRK